MSPHGIPSLPNDIQFDPGASNALVPRRRLGGAVNAQQPGAAAVNLVESTSRSCSATDHPDLKPHHQPKRPVLTQK
jgi:hypothetical protein